MINKEHYSAARGSNLPVSTKFSVEVCRFINGKSLNKAKSLLEDVVKTRKAVPFFRAIRDLGHKKGIGPGRYPVKVSAAILSLLKSAEKNAADKGLNTDKLQIFFASANKGTGRVKPGRRRGRRYKFTNVEVRVKEIEDKK